MMRKSRRVLLFSAALVFLFLLIPLAWMWYSTLQSERKFNAYLETLRQRGEALDSGSLGLPQTPLTGNGAADFVSAFESIPKGKLQDPALLIRLTSEHSPGQNLVLHRAGDAIYQTQALPWSTVQREFDSLAAPLTAMRESTRSSVFEIHPDYSQGAYKEYAGLIEFRRGAWLLAQQGLLFLQQGNPAAAAENLHAVLRLAGMTRGQVTIISRITTLNILDLAQAHTWELLQNDHLAEDTLASMQSGWERIDVLSTLPTLWRAERAAILPFFSSPHFGPFLCTIRYQMTGWPPPYEPVQPTIEESTKVRAVYVLWSLLCRYSDAAAFAEAFQTMIDETTSSTPPWNQVLARGRQIEDGLDGTGYKFHFTRLIMSETNKLLVRAVGTQTLASLTVTAIALQRYKLAHGEYPPNLSDLVPKYLSSLPLDSFDGSEIHYRRLEDKTFLLYANGRDAIDAGGDSTHAEKKRFSPLQGNDIVWPRPAPQSK